MTMELDRIDFLIIGAAKSATTWLQKSLQRDPNMFLPDPELHFFSREFERGHRWYLAHFENYSGETYVGEKSNSYLDDPHAARRIRDAFAKIKLIAQLRNPVERAYSDYCMLYRRGEVGRNIEDWLDPRRAAEKRFLATGSYFERFKPYFDLYDPADLAILLYEDIEDAPEEQLDAVYRFLGAAKPGIPLSLPEKVKDKRTAIVPAGMKRALKPLKPLATPFRGTPVFDALRRLVAKPVAYPPLSPDLKARMAAFFEKDSERLAAATGKDLSKWR